jgi:AraC-like DNA-binding protein
MTEAINIYAETIDIENNLCVLSDALNSMRISGSILLNEDYVPPWGISIPNANKLGKLLKVKRDEQVIAFHLVKRGYVELTPEGSDPIIIEAGEMAICFGGGAHRLSQESSQAAVSVETLLQKGNNPFKPISGNKVRSASLMCGVFMTRNIELNPLFSALPAILHSSAFRPGTLHNLPGVVDWISKETEQTTRCTFVIERLLELLCAEALRFHLETAPPESRWFAGIKDSVIGRALTLIHSRPGADWSVNRLAQGVTMSPSRFAARFTATLGDSPMAYLTKWRMNIAGRLLVESQRSIEEIAAEVGYENVTAFSRAFKRHLGVPPTVWRTR